MITYMRKYAVIDTETIGGFTNAKVLEVGIVICDKKGEIYDSINLICRETLQQLIFEPIDFWTPEKKQYYYDNAHTTINVLDWRHCCRFLEMFLKENKVSKVMAYNLIFDIGAIENSNKLFIGYDFLEGYQKQCIWGMACETICNCKKYQNFCLQNGLHSSRGNISTTAENVYRFITNNLEHKEAHTAISDAIEEAKIYAKCVSVRKPYTKGIIIDPWKIPQPKIEKLLQ